MVTVEDTITNHPVVTYGRDDYKTPMLAVKTLQNTMCRLPVDDMIIKLKTNNNNNKKHHKKPSGYLW